MTATDFPLVTIIRHNPHNTYTLADLEPYMLDPPTPNPPRTPRHTPLEQPPAGDRPGDLYSADPDNIRALLTERGWQLHHANRDGRSEEWTRPGKDNREGPGATLHLDPGDIHLTCYSSSTNETGLPDDRRPWTAFDLLKRWRHNDNLDDTVAWLKANGYSRPSTPKAAPALEQALTEPWPEPATAVPTDDLPPFPIEALPAWIADHATSVAGELQVPVDLPATLGIAALSTAAAGRVEVTVKSTWREQVNLYLVVAMPPGSGKSPAFRAMLAPIEEYEVELVEQSARIIAEAEQKQRMLDDTMKKAEKAGQAHEAATALEELHRHHVPKPARLIADDATPEALLQILADQNGLLALLSTEGGVFDLMTGRYGDRANLDVYLQGWAGDTIRNDRVGRDTALVIRNPAITIGLTVQPSVIAALAERPELAGRGLTSRFMYSVPVDFVGQRNLIDAPDADPAARAAYNTALGDLARTMRRYQNPGRLTIAPDARRMFLEWRQSLEDRRKADGDLRPLAEWTTKLESSVVRLAGLLHVADGGAPGGQVEIGHVARAIDVGRYWLAHARVVHDMWATDPVVGKARRILRWLRYTKPADQITPRDLCRALRVDFQTVEDTVDPLNRLVDDGWLRPLFEGPLVVGRRGVTSPAFAVHPNLTRHDRQLEPETPPVVGHVGHVPKDIKKDSLSLSEHVHEHGTPDMTDMTDNPADDPRYQEF